MLQEKAEWYVYHYFEASCNETYAIKGDSIVNDTVYKKFTAEPYCGWNTEKVTLLREDTIAKRVYKLLYDTTEGLIYDFSLQPGDSIVIKTEPIHQYTLYLDSITDYIQYYSEIEIPENSRVFYFKKIGAYQPIWIEGIGSLTSPLTSEYTWGHGALGEVLLCHYDSNGIKDYNDTDWQISECKGDIYVNIKEFSYRGNIKIFPVPSRDYLKVESMEHLNISSLQITDYLGKTVFIREEINNIQTDLDISILSSGIYIIKVEFDNRQIGIMKFIKK